MAEHSLAIIVPYRARKEHLEKFIPETASFLSIQQHNFCIFVIEQDDALLFNRAALLNIGVKLASAEGFDYFALHDVDTIPVDPKIDYSYPDIPRHLFGAINTAGGVVLISEKDFVKCNGMSNKYFGYGREDVDFLRRLKLTGVGIDQTNTIHRFSDPFRDIIFEGWKLLSHTRAFVYNEGRFSNQEIQDYERGEYDVLQQKIRESENWKMFENFEKNPRLMIQDGLNQMNFHVTHREQINPRAVIIKVNLGIMN